MLREHLRGRDQEICLARVTLLMLLLQPCCQNVGLLAEVGLNLSLWLWPVWTCPCAVPAAPAVQVAAVEGLAKALAMVLAQSLPQPLGQISVCCYLRQNLMEMPQLLVKLTPNLQAS